MNTFLSGQQQAAKEQYASFARVEVAPIAADLENKKKSLKDFLKRLGQLGYLGLTVPSEYGGKGAELLEMVLFIEAVSAFDAGLGLSISSHLQVIELIKKFAGAKHKSRYLPLLARGEAIGAFAISEEQAGTDYANVKCAVENGSLTGTKRYVVNGDIADLYAVLAKRAPSEDLCMQLVDASDKIKTAKQHSLLGLKSAHIADIEFNGASISPHNEISEASPAALHAMDIGKTLISASAVGIALGALNCARDHANTRQQFGESIGHFQGVQWKLADLSTECAAAQLLTYRAAWSEEGSPQDFRRFAAMCKLFATKMARAHCAEAVQVMGAMGLEETSLPAKYYRDAKVMEICQGTSEQQKLVLVEELAI